MSDQALRARTVPELVDVTFSLYRRNAPAYIMVTALASVPGLIVQLIVLGERKEITLIGSFSIVIVGVVSLVTYALMNGVVMKVGSHVYLGGEADVAGAVREVMPKVGTLIGVALLRLPLYFLGALCLFFGVFYVVARFFAVEAAVVLEDMSSGASFGRSTQLSDGRKWRILLALALGYGIYFILAIAIGGAGALLSNEVANLVLSTLFSIVAYPIIGILTMLLYYDARIRSEGFDVEQLARALGTPGTSPARP